MNANNRDTLCRIFADPTRADVDWDDFVRLVKALGGEWPKPGHTAGSRRRAKLNGRKGLFHSPHPGSLMKKGSVESAREFLRNAGVTPASEGCQC
ncbi:MAG: type II toxin-antitoxin system HicA family toxin [Alphaproteobacteria bacterium]|nr:type II toxin-antitoxin system HicA family toxin [Alphaproteobacteria bacterium]